MVNRRGPSTEPWETPWLTVAEEELQPLCVTNYSESERYDWKKERVELVRPR